MCKKSIPVVLAGVAMQCDAVEMSRVNDDPVTVTLHKTAGGSCCADSLGLSGRHVRFEFPNGANGDSGEVKSRFKERIRTAVQGDESEDQKDRENLEELVAQSEKNRFAQFSKKHRENLQKIFGEKYWLWIKDMPDLSRRLRNPQECRVDPPVKLVQSADRAWEQAQTDPLQVKLVARPDPFDDKKPCLCQIGGLYGGLKEGDSIPVHGTYSFRASQQCVFRQLIDAMKVFNGRKYGNYNVESTIKSELTDGRRVEEIYEDKYDKKLVANCVDFSDFVVTRIHKECLIEEETESNASAATNKDEKNGHKSRE